MLPRLHVASVLANEKTEGIPKSSAKSFTRNPGCLWCQEAKWKLAEMVMGLTGSITLDVILTVFVETLLKIHLFVHSKKYCIWCLL